MNILTVNLLFSNADILDRQQDLRPAKTARADATYHLVAYPAAAFLPTSRSHVSGAENASDPA
jgi:hypothetical protein